MKVNELRNDNWVSCIYNGLSKDVQVYDFDRKEIQHTDEGTKPLAIRRFDPIPLTEKWLLNFEFEHDIENNWFKITIGSDAIPILVRIWNENKIQVYYHWNFQGMNHIGYVKNVHQLQNLVFALTNKELTIK